MVAMEARRTLLDRYRVWKSNAPLLYDYSLTRALEWPSLTCEWLAESREADGFHVDAIVLGTHTSGDEQNHVIIAELKSPLEHSTAAPNADDDGDPEPAPMLEIVQKINHDGEVNRARHMPKQSSIIATKAVSGQVLIFNTNRHPAKPLTNGMCSPQLRLDGHKREGFALEWNTLEEGQLLSGSDDALICLWDIRSGDAAAAAGGSLEATAKFSAHRDAVTDVSWNVHQPHVFASVGCDQMLMLWDARVAERQRAAQSVRAHEQAVNAVAFNRAVGSLLVTASLDRTVAMWDVRMLEKKLHTLDAHADEVVQVAWSDVYETVLASVSVDRYVLLWDVSRVSARASDGANGGDVPPELVFVHEGHTGRVSDVSWHRTRSWQLLSVADDNIVQVWSPSRSVLLSSAKDAELSAAGDANMDAADGATVDATAPPPTDHAPDAAAAVDPQPTKPAADAESLPTAPQSSS